ncbi:MAG: VanZ family protein [Clostridia bacterium]|nr:VanZ family protein [Clostridia bacterium]
MSKRKDILTALLGVVVALILWITILSRDKLIGTQVTYHLFHALISFLKEIQRGRVGANFLGNIVLFIPVGVLVPIVADWRQLWKTAVIGFAFSLLIETLQLITSRGCFDLDDVILNGLGTVIGFGIYRAVEKLFTKTDLNAADNADNIALTNVVNNKEIKET